MPNGTPNFHTHIEEHADQLGTFGCLHNPGVIRNRAKGKRYDNITSRRSSFVKVLQEKSYQEGVP